LTVAPGTDAEELKKLALADAKIAGLVAGKTIVKVIAVPDKLVNIVVK
jgi:leucyl-tRNA synthetase